MIFDALLGLVLKLVRGVLDTVLPVSAPPDVGTISGALTLFTWLDSWLPVTETLAILALAIGLELALVGVATAMWVLGRFPFGKLLGGH